MVVGGEAKRWARDLERSGRPADGDRSGRCRSRRHPASAGAADGAGGGDPPPVGPRPAVRHDRERPPRGRGSVPGPAPRRGGRAVGPLQPGGPGPIPTPPSPPRWMPSRSPRRPPRTGPWPSPTTSGTPPSGRSTRRRRCCSARWDRPGGSGSPPTGGSSPVVGLESSHARLPPAAFGPPRLAGHGGTRGGGRRAASVARGRGRHHRAVQLLSGRGPGPAARCSAWTPTTTPTVTGGMAFAGGPFNNFVLQSMVPVVRALRAEPASLGMVTTVSGLLTKPGIGVWSGTPDGRPPLLADLADRGRGRHRVHRRGRDPRRIRRRRHRGHLHRDLRRDGPRPHGGGVRHRRRSALRGGGRRPRAGRDTPSTAS